MPMRVVWDQDDKTILRVEIEGTYTWDEYHEVLDEMFALADAHPSVYGVIAVRSADAKVPPNAISHFTRTTKRFKQRPHLTVVNVKHDPFMSMMTQMFAKNYDVTQQVHQAQTIEEAREILRRVHEDRQNRDE